MGTSEEEFVRFEEKFQHPADSRETDRCRGSSVCKAIHIHWRETEADKAITTAKCGIMQLCGSDLRMRVFSRVNEYSHRNKAAIRR